MNTLENLHIFDSLILRLTQKFARPFHKLIGIDNFGLANLFFVLSMLIDYCGLLCLYKNTSLIEHTLVFGFLNIILWKTWVDMPMKSYKRHFLNERRLQPFSTIRALFLLIIMGALFGTCLNRSHNEEFLGSILLITCMFIQLASIYLASIEPEDPSDSILKKLWMRLTSLLQPELQTQPA